MEQLCRNCDEPVVRVGGGNGFELDPQEFAWIHVDGNPKCDNGGMYDTLTGPQWDDGTWAESEVSR